MSATRVVVSGGTGFVGRFIVEALLAEDRDVVVAGRAPPGRGFFSRPVLHAPLMLGDPLPLDLFDGVDCFIHAAFDHVPGKYRGGEGDDPENFRRRNLDGSIALFESAKAAGVRTVVFLSSRAVYGTQPPGALLTEETSPHPNTLYGEVKLAAERHLLSMESAAFRPIVLRVTGVYGLAEPGSDHKWSRRIGDYLAGRPVEPRVATEVHGDDVARAASLLCRIGASGVFNVSDLIVDHHDLLAIVGDEVRVAEALTPTPQGGEAAAPWSPSPLRGRVRGGGSSVAQVSRSEPLPARVDPSSLNVMSTEKLRSLGWRPGGHALFDQTIRQMVRTRKA